MRQFNEYFWKLMPYPPAKILDLPQHDYQGWESSEYVADFIRPHRIWRKLSTRSLVFSVSLYRGRGDAPFSDLDSTILTTLAPHLEALYKRHRAHPAMDLRRACAFEIAHHHLTRREVEVLELAQGRLTNAEIGGRLGISSRTVEKHLANMYGKTGTSDRWTLMARLSRPKA
jgi:DNA-binding CsgD family transcriptional regulator